MTTTGRTTGGGARSTALRTLLAFVLAVAGLLAVTTHPAHAATTSTSQFKGVNWADQRDNFVNGVLYPSGLSSSDTHSSAATVANRVVGQLDSITGANTVRMPINEPTVSSYWSAYTGAVDAALSKGNVILAYWAYSNGKPASTTAFYQMWDTVVAAYGSNPNAYFEVINEPYAYSSTDLDNFYNNWLTRYPGVPRGRVILDGGGYATNVAAVGGDTRLDNTLLAVHDYSFFVNPPYQSESQWARHIAGFIGGYASRTIATEWGGPMSAGSKNGVNYGPIDYSVPNPSSFFTDYVRGVSSELRTLGVGSVYWPGLRDGDWYSLTSRTGSGSALMLSLVNASGLARLQYAWGIGTGGTGGGSYVGIENAATSLYADGMGRTTNGSNTGQSQFGTSSNQQWTVENDGDYVRVRNRATGLYLDGMGRTANGAAVGQYSDTNSVNQQWSVITDGSSVLIKNRGTGLYLDGLGRTTNGADLAQYSSSTSTNQRWKIVTES